MSEQPSNINSKKGENSIESEKLQKKISTPILIIISIFGIIVQMPFLFWPAGTLLWLDAWIYLISFLIFILAEMLILNKKNPQAIINRMETKKRGMTKAEGADKWFFPLISLAFFAEYMIPGFDFKNNWSVVPTYLKIMGFVFLWISFFFLYRSMLDNAFASKVLDIREDKGHKLIDTGSYAIVRHPMYTGFLFLVIGVPFLLGSWYALIPAVIFAILIILRIKFEEQMLIEGLPGYEEYKKRVKYKLIPKIF